MLRAYLLTFNNAQIERAEVIRLLESMPIIVNWMAILPAQIALVSEADAEMIANAILINRQSIFQFTIAVVKADDKTNNGWMPKSVWNFINNPQRNLDTMTKT